MARTPYKKISLNALMGITDANIADMDAIIDRVKAFTGRGERCVDVTLPIPGAKRVYSSSQWVISGDGSTGELYAVRMSEGIGVSVIEFSLAIWHTVIGLMETKE